MMNALDIMKHPAAYVSGYENTPTEEQYRAKQLCWEYNRTAPNEQEKRRSILQTLLGTCSPMTGIEPDFHCDYGFNIHTHGLAVINYNCVILDTSPVNIGAGAFIAPGVCLACSGHAIDPEQVPLLPLAYALPAPVMPSIRSSAAMALAPRHPLRWRKTSGSAQIPLSVAALPSGQARLSGREASSLMTFPPVSSLQGCPAR